MIVETRCYLHYYLEYHSTTLVGSNLASSTSEDGRDSTFPIKISLSKLNQAGTVLALIPSTRVLKYSVFLLPSRHLMTSPSLTILEGMLTLWSFTSICP